jgi:hypothetical protein
MNFEVSDFDVPHSFSASTNRAFDPIGVRDIYDAQFDRNNQRLTQEEVRQIIDAPPPPPQETRAERLTREENARRESAFEEKKFYNLSLKEIAFRASEVFQDILDDLLDYEIRDGFRGLLKPFIAGDRLVYLGIWVMVIGLFVMLIRSTESYDLL